MTVPDLARRIMATKAPGEMSTRIVAIDGPGGAGKTVLAERLAGELGNAAVLHTDDFASWENPLDWWPRLLDQVLKPLAGNETARYQRYDWTTKKLEEWHELHPSDFLILEGVSASRQAFRPYLAFSIWVETPREERLRRGLERDGQEARAQWEKWMEQEDLYIEREQPAQHANVVVAGTSN